MPQGAGLTGLPAAIDVRLDIKRPERVGGGKRLLDVLHQRRPREVVAEGTAVDVPLAGARREVHSGDAGLAPAYRLPTKLGCCCHALALDGVTENGLGCCAACGCSAPAYTLSLPRSFCLAREVLGNIPNTAFSMTRSGCLASRSRAWVKRSWPM